MVPVGDDQRLPAASDASCGTSLAGMPSRARVTGSLTIFQPTCSRGFLAATASSPRSCGLSTPVCRPPVSFWNALMALTMRSDTSPLMAPLYCPTQARSDWIATRSPCAMSLAVSAGVCKAGRAGVVAAGLAATAGFGGALVLGAVCAGACACAADAMMIIQVADSIDLMTCPMRQRPIEPAGIKHICWIGNSGLQRRQRRRSSDRSRRDVAVRALMRGRRRDDAVMLSGEEIERYARHIVLREIGGPGQAKLRAARVLVVGAGGLGAPALMYLAAAGIGTLGVIDDDEVSLSNLQRQIIHATPDIGASKVQSAADKIHALNPHVAFVGHNERLTAANAMALIGDYDLVLDGSDNFTTRYLVSDACYLAGRPLIAAALGTFDASLTTLRPH